MKSFSEAAQIVSDQITNRESDKLFCWEDDIQNSDLYEHLVSATVKTISSLGVKNPIDEIYSQLTIAICIGISLGLEMSKPSNEELFEIWKKEQPE